MLFNMSLAARPGLAPGSKPRGEAGLVIYSPEEIERMDKEQREFEASLIREAEEAAKAATALSASTKS